MNELRPVGSDIAQILKTQALSRDVPVAVLRLRFQKRPNLELQKSGGELGRIQFDLGKTNGLRERVSGDEVNFVLAFSIPPGVGVQPLTVLQPGLPKPFLQCAAQ